MPDVKWEDWNSKKDNFKKTAKIKSKIIYGKHSSKFVGGGVSIVLLTYKRADKLKKSLDSALTQDYDKPYEVIVLDDSGYDEATDALMKEYCTKYPNVVYYRNEKNLGQYDNWNRACLIAQTEWYCLLHDDDMLMPNYLTELTNCVKKHPEAGLIGVYEEANDTRDEAKKVRLLDRLVDLFIKLRHGKLIELKLKDNINHIYCMNSTFINKNKAFNIGGLDSNYFPSSDFAFEAKMAYYYQTYFLPLKLVKKGIGENESLKQSVCDDSIICAYRQTCEMAKALNFSDNKTKRRASIAAVCSEIGVRGYNNVSYAKVKESLGMKKIYDNKFIITLINIYSKFKWGMLLFR